MVLVRSTCMAWIAGVLIITPIKGAGRRDAAGLFDEIGSSAITDIKSAQQILEGSEDRFSNADYRRSPAGSDPSSELCRRIRLDHGLAVLRMFDEAAQPHVHKLMRDYFTVQPL